MKCLPLLALALVACGTTQPAERYGFIARLGRDTISVESVMRQGNRLVSDEVDRFPRVRQRHAEITLDDSGAIRHLVMDIHTPSEPENQRDRHVEAEVTADSVHLTKKDGASIVTRAFATSGGVAMAHLPQMYSLYELYFDNALHRAAASKLAPGDSVAMRQFYIDREFDNFPLHRGWVRPLAGNKAEIWHDWLSGVGEATFDSASRMLTYSGARSTYKVEVNRLPSQPDVEAIGNRFASLETAKGGVSQLSVRDTARATIGSATFTVDYGRPLARGRTLLGNVLPFDHVWRTGANAATQFTTSAPITIAGLQVPAGKYTLWTLPRAAAAGLIVNRQTGQWGTEYDGSQDLGRAPLTTERVTTPVEKFTISIVPVDAKHGTMVLEWGDFRWSAPIVVQ